MDRDPAAGLRHAMLRGVRSQLEHCALAVADEVARHAKLVGTDSGSAREFMSAGHDLLDAAQCFIRSNEAEFEDMRGGARLARTAEQFESALHEARKRQQLAQDLDEGLRQRLAHLPIDDEALGEPD